MIDWDDFSTYRPLLEASRTDRLPGTGTVRVMVLLHPGVCGYSCDDVGVPAAQQPQERPTVDDQLQQWQELYFATAEDEDRPEPVVFLCYADEDGCGRVHVIARGRDADQEVMYDAPELRIRGRRVRPKNIGLDARQAPPRFNRVGGIDGRTVLDVANPQLEALDIARVGGPVDLTPVLGLPRLRSVHALPGVLVDPFQVLRIAGLEHLMLGLDEWRLLLDGGTLPPGLQTAQVDWTGADQMEAVALSDEILASYGREPLPVTTLEGEIMADSPMAEKARRRWFRRA
ncbi:MAG: hypothetical protein FWE71_07420 [Nocardioidaceae bacterium]|nr:hypothetical protein [Nocardioidaceae bacterium]MCL2612434.1 hypothetical protein [Nocardioidaceae bacterium]